MIININSQIVSLVNLSENTVRKYIKEYEEGGIEKLKEINFYRPESELLEYKETLEKYFEKNPPMSIKEAAKKIEELTGIKRSENQVRLFIKRIGMKILKVGYVPGNADVEAWFLAEYNHFLKIDPRLTPEQIQAMFGFNPQTDDMEQRPHPADDMKQIYNYVGKGYNKSEKQLNRLASHLDYEFIYMHLINSVPSLGEFVGYIDKFMISP